MTAMDSLDGGLRTDFASSYAWSHLWVPKIKSIIGSHLIRLGTLEEDRQEATDLVVFMASGLRIACRLRKPGYAERFPWDITFTCRRETGSECEWDKLVLQRKADWFFYGHASEDDPDPNGKIKPWFIIDMKRATPFLTATKMIALPNRDPLGRRCFFYPFNVKKHPGLWQCVIASESLQPEPIIDQSEFDFSPV